MVCVCAWRVCTLIGLLLNAVLGATEDQEPKGHIELSAPNSRREDGMIQLEVERGADFSLTCASSGGNHSWSFEPTTFYDKFKEKKEVQYFPLTEKGLINSTLRVRNASYENTGNFSCYINGSETQNLHGHEKLNIYVFVKDPDHFVTDPKDKEFFIKAGDTLDYICRPTDPSLNVTLMRKTSDYGNFTEVLTPGIPFDDKMPVLYSVYRGYTLHNFLDYGFTLACFIDNHPHAEYRIIIHQPQKDPDIVVSPSTIIVGDNVTLSCTFKTSENYPPSAMWINEDSSVIENTFNKSYKPETITTALTLFNASKTISGHNYTCMGKYYHDQYNRNKTVNLHVIDYEVLNLTIESTLTKQDPPEITVKFGEDKQGVKIKIISNPRPKETFWYLNEEPIDVSGSTFSIQKSYDKAEETLIIKKPKPEHSGLYTFKVNNGKLKSEITVNITVEELLGIAVPGPKPIRVGDSITLVCGVNKRISDGNNLEWCVSLESVIHMPNEEDCRPLQPSNQTTGDKTFIITRNIINVTKDISGNYSCKNNGNTVDIFKINVLSSKKPIINREVEINQKVRAGIHLTLPCNATGLPEPIIIWYRNNVPLESDNETSLSSKSTTLTMSNGIKEKTEFKCIARNRFGEDHLTYTISPEDVGLHVYQICLGIIIAVLVLSLLSVFILYWKRVNKFKKEIEKLKLLIGDGKVSDLDPEVNVADQADLLPYKKEYEFPCDKLKLLEELGSGAFGIVMKAVAYGLRESEEYTIVAVKMAKRNANISTVKALASELKIMIHIGKHINVVNVLGACTDKICKRQLYVLVEYCRFGNLHNYILKHRRSFVSQINPETGSVDFSFIEPTTPSSTSSVFGEGIANAVALAQDNRKESVLSSTATDTPLLRADKSDSCGSGDCTSFGESKILKQSQGWKFKDQRNNKDDTRYLSTQDLLCWGFQIARGMEYLASKKVLHGDLAARNVLLADGNVVKICDFGLSKNMNNNYYQTKEGGPLPVKWLALESIQQGLFSSKSDVWAFGVTLWELFSLGQTPYPDIGNNDKGLQELTKNLKLGFRMPQPDYASADVYNIMKICWLEKPNERPTFTELVERLGDMLHHAVKKHYLELNVPFLEEARQKDYLPMNEMPNYENVPALLTVQSDPDETTPMMLTCKDAILLVSNPSYSQCAQPNQYVDMRSPTSKAEFKMA